MSFTETLWAETADLQERIRTMPFNTEMAAGTLKPETFRFYIIEDAHYLEGFARALALAAARAPDPASVAQLSGAAAGAIAVERRLHDDYMARYGITPEGFAAKPPSPACDHYVSFLIRSAAIDPFPVAVTALLPCFWIYLRVGQSIHADAADDHPYRAWIDTYAGEEFEIAVTGMLALVDGLATEATDGTRAAMRNAFSRSSLHEWTFWQSAYERRDWPQP